MSQSRTFLKFPIIHVIEDEEATVVFVTADLHFKLSQEDYQRYVVTQPDPQAVHPKRRTLEDRIAEASAMLRSEDPNNQDNLIIEPVPLPSEIPEVSTPDPVLGREYGPIVDGEYDEPDSLQTARTLLKDMDFDKPEVESPVRVNDEALPSLSIQQWRAIIGLIVTPITKEKAKSKSGRKLLRAKRMAFKRIAGMPLIQLWKFIDDTPKEIRASIVMYQCGKMGHGPRGEGSSHIPTPYAAYLEADRSWQDKEVAMYDGIATVRDPRPPQIKEPRLARAMEEEGYQGDVDLVSLESQLLADFNTGE